MISQARRSHRGRSQRQFRACLLAHHVLGVPVTVAPRAPVSHPSAGGRGRRQCQARRVLPADSPDPPPRPLSGLGRGVAHRWGIRQLRGSVTAAACMPCRWCFRRRRRSEVIGARSTARFARPGTHRPSRFRQDFPCASFSTSTPPALAVTGCIGGLRAGWSSWARIGRAGPPGTGRRLPPGRCGAVARPRSAMPPGARGVPHPDPVDAVARDLRTGYFLRWPRRRARLTVPPEK